MTTNRNDTATTTILHQLFEGFDSTGVTWVLLRGRAGLGVPGRDVDLLLHAVDLPRAEDVIFALGGIALPRALHPWHRFYVIEDATSGETLKLDVVVELIYHRQLRLRSELEGPLLDRRTHDGSVYVLGPTDMFWTVLLHCLLDKQAVNDRRRAELAAAIPLVVTPSPGQDFFDTLCLPGWSGARALERARTGDWSSLLKLGRDMVALAQRASASSAQPGTEPVVRRAWRWSAGALRKPRRWAFSAASAAYPLVWRAAGLGASPFVLDLADSAEIDVLVPALYRRPGSCQVDLLVGEGERGRLVSLLGRDRYRYAAGAWNRVTRTGIERVRVASPAQPDVPGTSWQEMYAAGWPMYRRLHCRRPPAPGDPGRVASGSRSVPQGSDRTGEEPACQWRTERKRI
jgi:hypothetical protein